MADLWLDAVEHDGGGIRLVLKDSAGEAYKLPVTSDIVEAIAATQPLPQNVAVEGSDHVSPHHDPEVSVPLHLSPRDIQSRLRRGATIDEVVDSSGLSRDYVVRYAGPVADERAYFASKAQESLISDRDPQPGSGRPSSYRLGELVTKHLSALGIQDPTPVWDAWKTEDAIWRISCNFPFSAHLQRMSVIGTNPPALWDFDPRHRSLRALNEWADTLSSPTVLTAAHDAGRPRLRAVDAHSPGTYADADGGVTETSSASDADAPSSGVSETQRGPYSPHTVKPSFPSASTSGTSRPGGMGARTSETTTEHQDLLDMLRQRRGQRLGASHESDDTLATMLTRRDTGTSARGESHKPRPVASPDSRIQATFDETPRTSSSAPDHRGEPPTNATSSPEDAPHNEGDVEPLTGKKSSTHTADDQDDDGSFTTTPLPGFGARRGARNPSPQSSGRGGKTPAADDSATRTSTFKGPASAETALSDPETADPKTPDSDAQDSAPEDDRSASATSTDAWGFSYEEPYEETNDAPEDDVPEPKAKRSRRPSMPRWDDILFGSSSENKR